MKRKTLRPSSVPAVELVRGAVFAWPGLFALVLTACAGPPAGEPAPAAQAPPAEARAVAVVAFTEGPAVDGAGNVYFTEMRFPRILKYTPGRGLTVFRENSNGANGLIFDEQGRLIAAEGGPAPRVTRTNIATGEVEVLAADRPDTPITRPNDVTLDGRGRIYFTDYGGHRIYRIDPDGGVHRILGPGQIDVPNGIVISPDDKTLYHVESNGKQGGSRCIKAYDLAEDGAVSNGRIFHNFYPGRSADGLAIDSQGNLYAAAGLNRPRGSSETLDTKPGVHVFAPDGRPVAYYPIAEDTVTNLAFGGPDLKTLYVTAGKTLFAVEVAIPGTRR